MKFANKQTGKRITKAIAATVLAGGLALMPACSRNDEQPTMPSSSVRAAEAPPTTSESRTGPSESSETAAVNVIKMIKGRQVVREGDYLMQVEFLFEKAGFYNLKVSKIDDRGIEVDIETEVFMSEHKSDPLRFNYGEENRYGEFVLHNTIRVEKGERPGTAVVEIIRPELDR